MIRQLRFIPASLALLAALTAHSSQSFGQADDWLPAVPTGTIEVGLRPFASGFGGSIDGINQVFATKMVPIPDGSGRLAVATFGGALRVLDADGNFLDAPLGGSYLDLTTAETEIAPGAYGTTSVAFHPDFVNSGAAGFGKIYALVSEAAKTNPAEYDFVPTFGADNDHAEVLAEYTVSPAAIGSNRLTGADVTRRELFVVRQPDNEHNYGDLEFDDQGRLYITAGDGFFEFNGGVNTEAQNAQSLSAPFGKILRIDPLGNNSANGQYGIPTGPDGNVFANDGDANTLGEIFSYGHRNPWRLSYDAPTGQLFVGEVGHFNIEEINVSQNGGNFGWPMMEGTFEVNPNDGFDLNPDEDTNNNGIGDVAEANGFIEPRFQYDHQEGVSSSGGFLYRGSGIPALENKFVFADLGRGGINPPAPSLFVGNPETGQFERVDIAPSRDVLPRLLVSMAQDAAGELYLIGTDGDIYSLIDPNNAPPPLVVNPSFEANGGSLDGWTAFGQDDGNVSVTDEPAQDGNALDGDHSLKMFGQFDGGFNFQGVFQSLPITGGERLKASVHALVRSADSIVGTGNFAEIKVEYYSQFGGSIGSGDFIRQEIFEVANGSSAEDVWLLGEIDDVAPENAVEARVTLIFIQQADEFGAVHFDLASLLFVPDGDFNADGTVDQADYNLWTSTFGTTVATPGLGADGNRNGLIDAGDYTIWRDNLGATAAAASLFESRAVPEPASWSYMLAGALLSCGRRLRRRTRICPE